MSARAIRGRGSLRRCARLEGEGAGDRRSPTGARDAATGRRSRAGRLPAPDHHRLRLGVVVERLFAVLLAVAARLPASEGKLVVDLRARVDPGVAGLDPGCGLAGPCE